MGAALALGVAILATLSAVFVMCPVSADAETYDGTIDLYGYKITMGLIEPDQVSSVEWDFGDGSAKETVQITSENPVGTVQHTYSAKGDYVVTATMRNQYTNADGQLVDGESKLTYLYHILGYPEITFETDGGTPVEKFVGTSSHYVPTKPADPVKPGFGFSGWYTDKECTQPFDWTSEVAKHTTLYAGWSETFYTVHFEYDGGVGTGSDLRIAEGNTATAPADPTKEGFDFDGWYFGKLKFDFATPITSDITLTAHWKEASEPSVPSEDDKNEDDGSDLWKIFVVVAGLCIFAMLVTGFYIAGIPAALFAILAIVSYLGVI